MNEDDVATISVTLSDGHVFIVNATDLEVWSDDEHDLHGMTWSGGDVFFDVAGEAGEDE